MKSRIIIFASLLVFVACSSQETLSSDDKIIPRDSMIMLMVDIHITDAILLQAVNHRKIQPNQIPSYYADLLKKHNVSKLRFDNSLQKYSDDLDDFSKMYDNIMAELSLKKAEQVTGKE
ncbi:MAG: DUF4296 domain-containing protein [Salinivirgaceae bacterium]|nr:DUF4296 domain-containing protein [Salinivirgaceae bacterium]MDD4747224.1 DUF4296 domain-containing protein [Salinivirgaceae bacterium]MDY0280849.1 DUF4296 domain-containing protein [Salinivirgaceae bacterium]